MKKEIKKDDQEEKPLLIFPMETDLPESIVKRFNLDVSEMGEVEYQMFLEKKMPYVKERRIEEEKKEKEKKREKSEKKKKKKEEKKRRKLEEKKKEKNNEQVVKEEVENIQDLLYSPVHSISALISPEKEMKNEGDQEVKKKKEIVPIKLRLKKEN